MIPVMIVEDEFLVRVGLQSMIDWEKHGFSVVADAPNGEKALELYARHRPHLILTDIRMSPMDGLELMRRIREMDAEAKFIVISAYDEFEYAQQAIRYGVELYLSKSCFTAEDLEPTLARIAEQYRGRDGAAPARGAAEEMLSALPAASDPAALERWFDEHGMRNVPKVVAVCRPDRSTERAVSQGVLTAIARDALEKEGLLSSVFTHDAFVAMLIGCAQTERVEAAMRHLCDTVGQYFSPQIYAGVSGRFTEPSYVFQALSDACKTCNDFLFDKSVHLRVYQREAPEPGFDKQLNGLSEEIQSRLYVADPEGVAALVERAVSCARNYRMLERAVFSVIMCLEKFDRSILVSTAFGSVMSDDLDAISRSLADWARRLCVRKADAPGRDTVDEIIDYIRKHLSEDISLVRLAEMYYFSANYLGQVFRQKTGIYFNTYVTNLRINRACELLLSTDDPVGRIGQLVGVEDPHYFSKIFKERMGVSPNKYRRMWST